MPYPSPAMLSPGSSIQSSFNQCRSPVMSTASYCSPSRTHATTQKRCAAPRSKKTVRSSNRNSSAMEREEAGKASKNHSTVQVPSGSMESTTTVPRRKGGSPETHQKKEHEKTQQYSPAKSPLARCVVIFIFKVV